MNDKFIDLNTYLVYTPPEEEQFIIVAGSRNYKERDKVFSQLDEITGWFDKVTLISGLAKGPDRFAVEYWESNKDKCSILKYPAKWKDLTGLKPSEIRTNAYGKYNPKAGMMRNREMLEKANTLIAFWDGTSKGTEDMINISIKDGLKTIVIKEGKYHEKIFNRCNITYSNDQHTGEHEHNTGEAL